MSWITVEQADTILASDTGDRAAIWTDLADDAKTALLGRASNRLELCPFDSDDVSDAREHGRYIDGQVPDADGTATDAAIPRVLAIGCALLARHYADNPDIELDQATGALDRESLIADLPLSVQSAIWPYVTDEAKGRNVLAVLRGRTVEPDGDRPVARPLTYVL